MRFHFMAGQHVTHFAYHVPRCIHMLDTLCPLHICSTQRNKFYCLWQGTLKIGRNTANSSVSWANRQADKQAESHSLAFFQLQTTITNIGEPVVCRKTQWSSGRTPGPMVCLAPVRIPTGGIADRQLSRSAPQPFFILDCGSNPSNQKLLTPLCDIPSGCCSFTGPWTVTRSSLRMLRWVAAFCRPLRPVLLLVLFPCSRSPVFGVLGLC